MIWSAVAVMLGLIVVVVLALLCSPLAEQPDPAMVWEARVAVGFAALGFAGPCWLAQAIVTGVATFVGGGVWPGWLWGWFVAAPLLGASPPAAALVRRLRPRRSPGAHSNQAAVQHEANVAWAATTAEPSWELRRTPPLPQSWPPPVGGPAVWLCYAERADTPGFFEVSAPWARVTLASDGAAWPSVQRLSDAVRALGVQSRQEPSTGSHGALLDAIYRGDPDGRLAKALCDWRTRNPMIAGHPEVSGHLPGAG